MKLFLCYQGQRSEKVCKFVAVCPDLNFLKNQVELIPIDTSNPEQIRKKIKETKELETVWVFASDEPLPMALKREFFQRSKGKIFCNCGDGEIEGLAANIVVEIRKWERRLMDFQAPENLTDYIEPSYEDLAGTLATNCRYNLVIEIDRLLSQSLGSANKKNRYLCQSMVALLQPPLPGVPVSGSVDVGVCLHIAREVFQQTDQLDQYPPIEKNNESKIANTNWESLFTLFYASFIYSGTSDITMSNSGVTSDIVVTFKKTIGRPPGGVESNVRDTFDKLIKKAEKDSGFWKAVNDDEKLVIYLQDKTIVPTPVS
jgi:hypothetical protein